MRKEEKRKESRRFNLLDIFIILVVLVLVGGGWIAYSNYTRNQQANMHEAEYQVEIKGVDQSFVDSITKGDALRESIKGNALGTVADVIAVPASNVNTDYLNGKFVMVPVPNKLDLVLKIKSPAVITEKSISVGGLTIKIGQRLYIKGKGYANQGYILNIDIKE